MNRAQAVMEWIATTRVTAPGLDADADALLLHLLTLSAQQQAVEETRQQRCSIALWGHSRAAKSWLLTALRAGDDGQLPIVCGEKRLDYLSHINPGHQLSQMAIRFTHQSPTADAAFPLRLRLLREAQLAQIFIDYARQNGTSRPLNRKAFTERLASLQMLRQPQTTAAVTAEEAAGVARYWQSTAPSARQEIDDGGWYQFAELLPALDPDTRIQAWSLLWGDQQELTLQWQSLVRALHLLGYSQDVHAPLSLLIDDFMLPADGFLLADSTCEQTVIVQLPGLQTVTLSGTTLALLTFELVLNCEEHALRSVDLIDIPAPQACDANALWASKCHWLPEGYRQQQQPDLLLICNAAAQRSDIPHTAKMLTRWVETIQPQQDGGLPGLVWAITPHDDRIVRNVNHDEAVQQLVGKLGQRWGTLHAFDSHSLQRLIEWLTCATSASARERRLSDLTARYQEQLAVLLRPVLSHPVSPRSMIQALQAQASRHGELLEGLLPPLEHFSALTATRQVREGNVSGLFRTDVDLFAVSDEPSLKPEARIDAGTLSWRLWCQHLRHWSRQRANAQRLGITGDTLQQLADTLIAIGCHLDLAGELQAAATRQQAGASQLRAIVGNFIAWLGYTNVSETQRPASRIAQGSAIFASAAPRLSGRLTRLEEQPVHAASRYVYDWLVALFTRASESGDAIDIYGITPQARVALQRLLAGM
ncbi:virulence factor SrfC family protein [Pseudocitrobacter cyperus]|uniref:Virulence factor SrfC family protein n=1 Tax=Pseudocitrobacter cyperus TaxID=3112843 RepID=A0ABV0HDL4_9ENTR